MHVLLLRPVSPNERFGLGPFFRVEPLGLEYVASALLAGGHSAEIVDLRFAPSLARILRRSAPRLVGISCLHAVDIPAVLELAAAVKTHAPGTPVVVGGHVAGLATRSLAHQAIDMVCTSDGELTVPALATAIERGASTADLSGIITREDLASRGARPLAQLASARPSLDEVALPARQLVQRYRRHYACVHKMPLWAIETARGCPYRCSFCSVWAHSDRSFRVRGTDAVCRDFASVGENVFVVDDLFWHPPARSTELGHELIRRGIRKDWVLVQARLDTVAHNPGLLEVWRPLARQFDVFFGFEAPRNDQLHRLRKDMTTDAMTEGVKVARALGYGVTGNFVVDPDWSEDDFAAMWELVDRLQLNRAGYTILTPLPGTQLFESWKPRLREHDWSRYDMHHLPFEPMLGRERFFELFAASWRRNVLGPRYAASKWWSWARELDARQALILARVLRRTQRMLDSRAYLRETFPASFPAMVGEP